MLWGSDRGEALSRGNVLHELMAHIERGSDLEPALKRLIQEGSVAADESDELRQLAKEIVDHAVLAPYYREGITVRNEAEIITKNGRILRPDRIVLNHRKATLLDYKTGKPNVHFVSQLSEYSQALEDMGYVVENKIIVYIDKGVFPEFI